MTMNASAALQLGQAGPMARVRALNVLSLNQSSIAWNYDLSRMVSEIKTVFDPSLKFAR